ncbi:helix-turn-helix domain-containing protein [Parachryseolinea silvisoli]|uniref:helix-turn-helix domain-containing protein n=1 Tax=Parachryseolinea silvisoli TaxID=2873601 RepID=UPI0022658E78|nr:helix-turn-helix domain-containing protein [Parachryseolinea silvisoli]MCD9015218.1 helix-turn-helix domain-containing protein [Parachryseolinea silvisoli]
MEVSIATTDDLQALKKELVGEIRTLLGLGYGGLYRRWLKTEEVMKLLELSASTLQTLRRNGTLPFSRVGAIIFYDAKDIERMIEARKIRRRELINSRSSAPKKRPQKKQNV